MFNKDDVPTEVSRAWILADVCTESQQMATPYCPSRESRVFLNREITLDSAGLPEKLQQAVREDADLEKPPNTARCTASISWEL